LVLNIQSCSKTPWSNSSSPVRGDDDQRVVGDAQLVQPVHERAHHLVRERDAAVVQRQQVLVVALAEDLAALALAQHLDAQALREGMERALVVRVVAPVVGRGRVVGRVRVVVVHHREEGPVLVRTQEAQGLGVHEAHVERLLHLAAEAVQQQVAAHDGPLARAAHRVVAHERLEVGVEAREQATVVGERARHEGAGDVAGVRERAGNGAVGLGVEALVGQHLHQPVAPRKLAWPC
jgi:hypothetical protein